MAQAEALEARYGQTHRTDRWWLEPLVTGSGLLIFVIYSTVVGVLGEVWDFEAFAINPDTGEEVGHYLSPFFEPLLHPGWAPDWISPAIFILWAPIGFRTTCYYYRRTYYRAYFLSPPACAVKEPASSYSGESGFPLILQNAHRYTFYAAFVITIINTYDAILAFNGENGFGIGLGNVLLVGNVILLWFYTLSCHSCRHVTGGRLKHFSRHPLRYRWWTFVSKINTRHMQFAWITLASLVVVDAYIMAVSAGWITDLRFIN